MTPRLSLTRRLDPQLLPNQLAQALLDLAVSGYGRNLTCPRIQVEVVPRPVAFQRATGEAELPDELATLQIDTSISFTLVAKGIEAASASSRTRA